MKKVLLFLQRTMTVPEPLGCFHLVAIALMLLFTVSVCVLFKNADEKTYRTVLLSIWGIMITMEIIKQVSVSAVFAEDGTLTWHYRWSSFPLQLCDSPLYLLPIIAFLKDGKVRDALSSFTSTYILLGGVSTYILISTTFCNVIYLNVQTLAHHGLQIVSSLFIAIRNRERTDDRSFLRAIGVFAVAVLIATTFNVVMHYLVPDQVINMFFISPFFKKEMPILNEAWHALHWAPTILLYLVGVTIFALLVHLIYRKAFESAVLRRKAFMDIQKA